MSDNGIQSELYYPGDLICRANEVWMVVAVGGPVNQRWYEVIWMSQRDVLQPQDYLAGHAFGILGRVS